MQVLSGFTACICCKALSKPYLRLLIGQIRNLGMHHLRSKPRCDQTTKIYTSFAYRPAFYDTVCTAVFTVKRKYCMSRPASLITVTI